MLFVRVERRMSECSSQERLFGLSSRCIVLTYVVHDLSRYFCIQPHRLENTSHIHLLSPLELATLAVRSIVVATATTATRATAKRVLMRPRWVAAQQGKHPTLSLPQLPRSTAWEWYHPRAALLSMSLESSFHLPSGRE